MRTLDLALLRPLLAGLQAANHCAAGVDDPAHPSRIANHQSEGRHIAGHHRSHADHRPLANAHPWPDRGVGADGRAAADHGLFVKAAPHHLRPGIGDIRQHAGGPQKDVVLDLDGCRVVDPALPANDLRAAAHDAKVIDFFRERLALFAGLATGSSTRIARAMLLDTPLSIDRGEVTDKGSVNQRAVLEHRAPLVEELYAAPPGDNVITPG